MTLLDLMNVRCIVYHKIISSWPANSKYAICSCNGSDSSEENTRRQKNQKTRLDRRRVYVDYNPKSYSIAVLASSSVEQIEYGMLEPSTSGRGGRMSGTM